MKEYFTRFLSVVFVLLFLDVSFVNAQTAELYGTVVDGKNVEIDAATITINDSISILSNAEGKFKFILPTGRKLKISVNKKDTETYEEVIVLKENEKREFNVRLAEDSKSYLKVSGRESPQSETISPSDFKKLPSINGLELLAPLVDSYNELSSQYAVRGGNYDENLIYVNGIEVYRPLLARSGAQEGLGFVNPEMIENIDFSSGGWQPKYGDKMSSSLDILYRKPKEFEVSLVASLLGGGVTIGNKYFLSKDNPRNKNLTFLVSGRYQNNNLILNTLNEDTDFNPVYYDVQSFVSLKLSRRFTLDLIANIARNTFQLRPKSRTVSFGTAFNPIQLNVDYQGFEDDSYQTEMAALTGTYTSLRNKLTLTGEVFTNHITEQEYFDILGTYFIQDIDPLTGGIRGTSSFATQLDHARNDLDYLVLGFQHRGKLKLKKGEKYNHNLEWGLKYQNEDVRDLLNEWQLFDDGGFTPPTPPFDPGLVDTGPLTLNYSVNARSNLNSNRFSNYLQYHRNWKTRKKELFSLTAGVRSSYWDFTDELIVSPRFYINYRPNWKKTTDFWFSTGLYYQQPFYKEVRDVTGVLQNDVLSQRSIHFIIGNNYYFKMLNRNFRLTSELYYKKLDNLIPYFLDNVRLRYTANNNSKGFVYGIDTRLKGELVNGAESWFRISYTRAKENIDGRGLISRPTDQRLRLSLLYQDYMPELPFMKASLRLVYANGLPNGAPFLSDPYDFQSFLSDYRRVDLGLIAMVVDPKKRKKNYKNKSFGKIKEMSLAVEVFNLFDLTNTVSNQYIRDVANGQVYAIPNRLSRRFFNLKLFIKI